MLKVVGKVLVVCWFGKISNQIDSGSTLVIWQQAKGYTYERLTIKISLPSKGFVIVAAIVML